MKKALVAALLLVMSVGTVGCGAKKDNTDIIVDVDKATAIDPSPTPKEDSVEEIHKDTDDGTSSDNMFSIEGTWQTVSMGNEEDGILQPEYYVQFTDSGIDYGHMKDGEFVLDHSDKISSLEELATGKYRVQAESSNGVQYTYQTSESDNDILEYYETWNEEDFSSLYSGSASLNKVEHNNK